MSKVSLNKIKNILSKPLDDLIFQAQTVHKKNFKSSSFQLASLISIKTGSCPEDCKYCPQSAHYNVDLKKERLIEISKVEKAAKIAKSNGADRFCMGAAWKKLRDGDDLNCVIQMIKIVKSLGLETCVTLGSITKSQAKALKKAGLDAYNHNIDTSPEYYSKIITTRTFHERLDTIKNVRDAGISVCCGGIIGMGESWDDRASMLQVLANLSPQPESVPINALVPVNGTPLQNQKPVEPIEMIRMVATARILMPKSRIRLSAGRKKLSQETQILCMISGANSIFYGESLLTTKNNDMNEDKKLISIFNEKDKSILSNTTF
ncbi:MAG: biotin synthase BioB [Rickettsiales bacterium]|nr:biotin synthase BioB [Rickettsiales bacterium]|tara:strand:+ start:26 stop:985 length:960 start_codon:yes stop_codon:yes gene_type:complete